MFNILENYKSILLIRQKSSRQNAMMMGGILGLVVLLNAGNFLLSGTDGAVSLITFIPLLLIGFGVFYWAMRVEICNSSIELIENLQRDLDDDARYRQLLEQK